MIGPADLGTLSKVKARTLSNKLDLVKAPWNSVRLHTEGRNCPGMKYVRRRNYYPSMDVVWNHCPVVYVQQPEYCVLKLISWDYIGIEL